MFKLESYITPILLSYVDKYIKNFRPEDSQVSLWGGDASFLNLDLRLEVLEQELQLPFSFVSGHIHELLIHVPWTKLASEPIHITINTIECILKLKGDEANTSDSSSLISCRSGATGATGGSRKRSAKREEVVAPPGYIQSLVNKIVSNITIVCNNLILKYVEEDIVLSVNVKTVTLQSANEKWEPSYTELSHQLIIRKLINFTDLTVCLDKRTSSGKIELYQEPLLYRCSVVIHLLRNYRTMTSKQASTTRIDIKCGRMDFSLTEQQVPMLMRLVRLALALHARELRPEEPTPSEPEELAVPLPEEDEEQPNEESWAGWAWSFVPSLLPTEWDEDWNSEHPSSHKGHTFHTGVYVQQASISLKYTLHSNEQSYYTPKKVKFVPFLIFQLKGCYMQMISQGVGWFNCQFGISEASLEPHANCFCGVKETTASPGEPNKDPYYMISGMDQDYYLTDSLFDPECPENLGKRRAYITNWEYHMNYYSESTLLAKTAAFAFDYVYNMETPDDFSSEQLSELGSDLEYSNLAETVQCRIVFGKTVVRICSGLLHRLKMVQHAAAFYDYSPYTTPKPELTLEQLPPASSDDFEALNEYIPLVTYRLTLFQPSIHFHLHDHPTYDTSQVYGHRKRKKSTRHVPQFVRDEGDLPVFSIECRCLDASVVRPMYPQRLIATTCKLPDPPSNLFHACHKHTRLKAVDLCGHLHIKPGSKPVTVVMPCTLSLEQSILLKTEYWVNPDLFHCDRKLCGDGVICILTTPRSLIISYILQSILQPGAGLDILHTTSLLEDASRDVGIEFLEVNVEGFKYHNVTTPFTHCHTVTLSVVRAFVLLTEDGGTQSEAKQALVLSGPAAQKERNVLAESVKPLLSLSLQMPLTPENQHHPPLVICNMRELRVCVDPLLWQWMQYSPTPLSSFTKEPLPKPAAMSESTAWRPTRTSVDNSKRPAPQESVHSSSDQQMTRTRSRSRSDSVIRETHTVVTNTSGDGGNQLDGWRARLLHWFPMWRGLVLSGDIDHCIVYLPTASLSAVGVETIEEALERYSEEVLVVKLPYVTLRSAAQKQGLQLDTDTLPVLLPDTVWNPGKVSFPWSVVFSNASCYTVHSGNQLHFLKPVSANATIAIAPRYQPDDATLSALNFCVHIDISRVKIAVSDIQMRLITNQVIGLLTATSAFAFHHAPPSDAPVIQVEVQASVQSYVSPTFFQESTASRETTSTSHILREISRDNIQPGALTCDIKSSDVVNLTATLQCTLARLSLLLYTEDMETEVPRHKLKLQFDMDDLFTTLDLQDVYVKIKSKVASASVMHFRKIPTKAKWKLGPYLGLVMRANEELSISDTEENQFLQVIFTRARCRNTQNKWGIVALQRKHRRTSHMQALSDMQYEPSSDTRYISEIVVKVQPVDFVFSPQTLSSFMSILNPLNLVPKRVRLRPAHKEATWTQRFNNHTLPLLYLDTKALRVLLPCSELTDVGGVDDVCVIQIESVNLQPQAVNPIGRVIVRADLYAAAERSRTLHVPGADIEDRQYQLDIAGFSLNTGTWQELDPSLSIGSSYSDSRASLKTMSENPAVQWNSMAQGQDSLTPNVRLTHVITRLELCIVAAPAIMDHRNTLVCGHSLEVNALTDIDVSISTETLLLASRLCGEVVTLLALFLEVPDLRTDVEVVRVVPQRNPSLEKVIGVTNFVASKDSGLNMDTVSVSSKAPVLRARGVEEEKSSGYQEDESLTRRPAQAELVAPEKEKLVPMEILFTAGAISLVLFENIRESSHALRLILNRLKDKAEERRVSGCRYSVAFQDEDDTRSAGFTLYECNDSVQIQPLLFALLAQPHVFISRRSAEQKVQVSCFDVGIRTSSQKCHLDAATIKDFPEILLETKNGDPHPDTGCPPSFVTLKWIRSRLRSPTLSVEFGRPTKLHCSLSKWMFLKDVFISVMECLTSPGEEYPPDNRQGFTDLTPGFSFGSSETGSVVYLGGSSDLQKCEKVSPEKEVLQTGPTENVGLGYEGDMTLTMQQFVVCIDTLKQVELVLSFASMCCSTHHPLGRESITGNSSLNSLTVTTINGGITRMVVNPWSCTANLCVTWEPWLSAWSPPLVQVTADSDCLYVDVGPEQLRCLYTVWMEYKEFVMDVVSSSTSLEESCPKSPVRTPEEPVEQEQQYRDDLRAGAFQFVETAGSKDELPFPYQVVFWQDPPMMAWRYPQPRALTRVDVFPVPFKVAIPSKNTDKQQVFCWLQYWSEVRGRFLTSAQFTLSESEVRRLELPGQTVACVWRVQLALSGEDEDDTSSAQISINPKTLAACMRVDSYFSPKLVPLVQAALNISVIQLSLYNHLEGKRCMPAPLKDYTCYSIVPTSQGFFTAQMNNASFSFSSWPSKAQLIDISSHFRVDVVDYAYLTQHCVVEPFRTQLTVNIDDKLSIACVTKPISIRYSTAAGHTLMFSMCLWMQALKEFTAQTGRENAKVSVSDELQVVISRFVICNDTTGSVRFGQCGTDEDILLNSRQCHFYAWRSQKSKPQLRVCLEGAWVWSEPFPADVDGTYSYSLTVDGQPDIIVKVSSLSGTQKQITISGQLKITNLLVEHFECKIIESDEEEKREQAIIIMGNSTPPSIFLDPTKKATLRLRFNGLELWTGDIPLKPNELTCKPWLVKVPLQDHGKFICIWCHIVNGQRGSVLAALYPLFSIRSFLPLPATLLIDTPGLNVHMSTVVKGGGAEQQLYCPGTTDHTHKLTLQLESSPPSPSVPLSYAMLERRKTLTPSGDLPDIDDIIKALHQPPEPTGWPFSDKEYSDIKWEAPIQPKTEILVHYDQRGPYCATLLVQLLPWALILNTLGCPLDLVVEESIACHIPHQGVLTPPRLDGTFHLAISAVDKSVAIYRSSSLSLHKPGSSFYMPRISGLIPVNGCIPVSILSGYTVAMACIASKLMSISDDSPVRVIHVKPSYVLVNKTDRFLRVMCVAVHKGSSKFSSEVWGSVIVPVPPQSSDGHPLVHWSILDDGDTELVPYILISIGGCWSKPLQVNNGASRLGFSISTNEVEYGTIVYESFVLALLENEGQTYLTVYSEPSPHVTVTNLCKFDLFVAEGVLGGTEPVPETSHIAWHCCVEPNAILHYSFPTFEEGFPDLAIGKTKWPNLVLALATLPRDEVKHTWSVGINISEPHEHFVRLPFYGDVKVRIEIVALTSYITIETVSHVEISAGEIRTRLLQQNNEQAREDVSDYGSETSVVQETVEKIALKEPDSQRQSKRRNLNLRSNCNFTSKQSIIEMDETAMHSVELSPLTPTGSVAKETESEEAPPTTILDDKSDSIMKNMCVTCFLHGFNLTLVEDLPGLATERIEIISLTLTDVGVIWKRHHDEKARSTQELHLNVADLQLDNQMFQRGGYDFPVLLMRQTPYTSTFDGFSLATPAQKLIDLTVSNSMLSALLIYEGPQGMLTDVKLGTMPISLYLEDTLLFKFVDSLLAFMPNNLVYLTPADPVSSSALGSPIPAIVEWRSLELARPVRLHSITIDPIELLLSIHAYIKLYLALDRSPLSLHSFERRLLETTFYRLGKVFAMHYITDAIFGAGWVVGSMELLGSPGGLCRTVGSGLKDFMYLPFQGIFQGPWGFLLGATHGSASLLRHCAAGAVGSVTGLATSVARNLDCLSLDSEHVQRSEELRRLRPQSIREGITQGLSGFGINLLGAVGGLAHHPLQVAISGNATPRNVAAGVGVGIVGAIVKPLSGAAELVASAGRGLLQGTGWSMLPEQKATTLIEHACTGSNSRLKYMWMLPTGPGVLYVAEVTYITPSGSFEPIALVLTARALFLVDTEDDCVRRILSLTELSGIDCPTDPTLLSFVMQSCIETDIDATSRARVVDYVKHSSGHIQDELQLEEVESLFSSSPADHSNAVDAPLRFYVNPQVRNYFLAILQLAKRQCQGLGFTIL